MSKPSARPETVVVDASVLVDLLADTQLAEAAHIRLHDVVLHAPAHVDAEVLSALGRMYRAGERCVEDIELALTYLGRMPVQRHDLTGLLAGAWARRDAFRLVDALYVELAAQLNVRLITSDHRLARACSLAEGLTALIPDQAQTGAQEPPPPNGP